MAPGTLGNAIVQVALSKHYKGAKGLMNIALLPRFMHYDTENNSLVIQDFKNISLVTS